MSDIPPPAVTETDTTINVSAPEFVPSTMNDPVSSSVISAQSTYTSINPQAIPQSASASQQTFPILYQYPTTSIMHHPHPQINPSTINSPHHLGTSTAPRQVFHQIRLAYTNTQATPNPTLVQV